MYAQSMDITADKSEKNPRSEISIKTGLDYMSDYYSSVVSLVHEIFVSCNTVDHPLIKKRQFYNLSKTIHISRPLRRGQPF